jgi:hypothetical protein
MVSQGLTHGTHASYDSATRLFLEFCLRVGVDFDAFGVVGAMSPSEEDDVLMKFAIYGCENPRRRKLACLSAGTMEGYLAGVRSFFHLRHGRRPGRPPGEAYAMKLCFRGLHKLYPSPDSLPREPILQQHMRALRAELDLADNQLDRFLPYDDSLAPR